MAVTTIELYLVRHAIAARRGPDYPDDRKRPLTNEGIARFKQAVDGFKELDCQIDLVLTSPLVRATETAELLLSGLNRAPKLERLDALAPQGRLNAVLEAIATFSRRYHHIALVGHEPGIGELAAKLLRARGAIEFKKGAICCIELQGTMPAGPGVLRWHLPPKVLRGLAR
jgi:phosphohistidine phosphatase